MSLIIYEAKLTWYKNYNIPLDKLQNIVRDVNSFAPEVPVQNIKSLFIFSVNENKKSINIKTEINTDVFFDGEEPEDGWESLLDETIIRRIKDLLFVINLAHPGCLHIIRNHILKNGKPLPIKISFATDISGMVHDECKWLELEELELNKCWNWILSKTNFLSYLSLTPIDRALHSLSYESKANDDMYIFYVMLGIEAIYNNGSNKEDSILAQIRRKSQALLGNDIEKAHKHISNMYALRSKLVHGSANIYKCWNSEYYKEDEDEKVFKERLSIVTATGLLLATIQKFIKANANTLTETITVKLE